MNRLNHMVDQLLLLARFENQKQNSKEETIYLNAIILDFEPGDKVINPDNKEWGIGQVQSIINEKITVNFENAGKKVINSNNIKLEKFNK